MPSLLDTHRGVVSTTSSARRQQDRRRAMAIVSAFLSPSRCPCFRPLPPPSPSSRFVAHGLPSRTPRSRSSATAVRDGRRHLVLGASSRDIPSEIIEESKFVPLNEDDPIYGPPALLLTGFDLSETAKMKQFLKDMEGDFLKIIYGTEDMLTLTVWDAMHVQQQNLKAAQVAGSLPRVCIFSGLSGEEMMMFIDAFPETGLAPAVFAAMVPNSADKVLGEVIDEIMGDHELLAGSRKDIERESD